MDASRPVSTIAVLAVVVLATVGAGFAFVDASALQGETATDSTVSTAQLNRSTASLADPVTLFVSGDGWLETAVGDRIAANLEDRGATVTRVDSLDGPTAGPVLVVTVADADVSYNPVAPSATVEASFAYVQSGNVTLATGLVRDEPLVVSTVTDAYVAHGDVTVRDRTRGVATWPAYQRRVTTATADGVVRALEGATGMDQPS